MSDILSTFRQKAEDLAAAINRSGGLRATIESLRRQMAEADRRRAMTRAKGQLKRLDAQIAEMVTAVGVQAVGLHKAGNLNSPELQPLCQHIVELEAELAQQRAELARLEALAAPAPLPEAAALEERFCAHCGAPLREGARFCARCGKAVAHV